MTLLAEIDALVRAAGMLESNFGRLAVNDPSFVAGLRRGRKVGSVNKARARQAIERIKAWHQVNSTIRSHRAVIPARELPKPVPVVVDPIAAAAQRVRHAASSECRALLRAHLRTGKHWITDPARFAEACAQAGLAA